ncbi:sensor histidine kinase [Paenibacillus sp. LHD-117]|uniref:sensor histidine kinase n=1 Tax=Paenibacillus sp. LHD-117 TaxID=3071412 RepID=UPI0027DFE32A|nr:sensor histidine kinase [Paenibacillus sp. LHD-117]MDQ6422010.1 sensor histidine kinase [Paenibacillus sp. LHD-117]
MTNRLTIYICIAFLWAALSLTCSAEVEAKAAEAIASERPTTLPSAESGRIDVSEWRFERDGPVAMEGEWAFYWRELLEPDSLEAGTVPPAAYAHVPDIWSSYSLDGQPLSNQGYATYKLTIRFAESDAGKSFSLWVPNAATAYRLWIDGKEAGGNGIVGESRAEMVPKNYSKAYLFVPSSKETEIVIQVSNLVQRKGGLWDELKLGYADQINRLQVSGAILQSGMAGILLIMGLYHLALFFMQREYKEALFFGGLCLIIGLRTLTVGQTLLIRLFPDIPWEIGVKIEYWGFILGLAFFLCYVKTLFPRETSRWYVRIVMVVASGFSLLVLLLPASVYTRWMLPYQIVIVISFFYIGFIFGLATWRKRNDAWMNLASWIFLLAAVVNDVLFYNLIVVTGDLFPFCLLSAIIIQMVMLTRRYSRTFHDVKRLSWELAVLNDSLELKIRERTAELEEAGRQLARTAQARRRLMSNISHELGTPLSLVQGYVKGMIDGVIPPDNPSYLRLIYDKTIALDRLINDLGELSKLEAKQVSLDLQPVRIRPLAAKAADGLQWEFGLSGLTLEAVTPGGGELTDEPVVRADAFRLEQVLINFLSNAKKHTPAGGHVRMDVSMTGGEGGKRVFVSVTDGGEGIDEAALPFVFERYYQAQRKDRKKSGMGLGLAICKEIIELHGGEIGVRSKPGEGSTFYFTLPMLEKD